MGRTAILTLIAFILSCDVFCGLLRAQHPGCSDFSQGVGYPDAPIRGYFQPTKILGPEGSRVALAADNRFVERDATPLTIGLMIGPDYRMRITNIPHHPGKEVFPSVKVIGRTYPPRGHELEFPIPIEISQEDIELALDGKFVTRVVYLESPNNALPIRGDVASPITNIVSGDPIHVASELGQPIAIVRIGGRIPQFIGGDLSFFLGCPPWQAFNKTPAGHYEMSLFQNSVPARQQAMSIPRVPLSGPLPRPMPSVAAPPQLQAPADQFQFQSTPQPQIYGHGRQSVSPYYPPSPALTNPIPRQPIYTGTHPGTVLH